MIIKEGKTPKMYKLSENSILETSATAQEVEDAINYVKTYSDFSDEMLGNTLKAVGHYVNIIYLSELDNLENIW
jgi:hypothetical protein